ncbi:Sec-independent protein translocase subunit TatA/TatB [Perlabentimonas gracilis]|jgi:sec-independent protein translocase protein TatA|uniref:Sec-independent protein translocase subunit TatA/TatB n=1 Tax=Perlabentimonas gracilis TaxID=2715279 RepID=UPI001407BC1C|nr:twin-arginine translocase TatA/TatE family subunit [Perlabentimonas gracilis]NHB69470.1 twin-arginine translocase TatA/TatE family subunit [Perlabentimonas gracilis]
MLLFIGGTEIILIVFVVLLLFGSKKIPEVARAIGKGYREFQKATDDIKRELSDLDTNSTSTNSSKTSSSTSPEDSADYQQKN